MPQLQINEDTLWVCHMLQVQCKIGGKQYSCLTTMKQAAANLPQSLPQKSPNAIVVVSCCWILIFAKLCSNYGRLSTECNLLATCNKLLTRCCPKVVPTTGSLTHTYLQVSNQKLIIATHELCTLKSHKLLNTYRKTKLQQLLQQIAAHHVMFVIADETRFLVLNGWKQ